MLALELAAVDLDYPGRPGVLRGVSLSAAPGDLVVIEGRSGSGKSSILAVAAGLEPATRGSVRVFGSDLDARDAGQAAALRDRHIGLVFQHLNLLGELNVQENVELPLLLRHVPAVQRRAAALDLLERFGVGDLAHRLPSQLSGGEQQRVALARALAPRPGLLLVDEPTSSLDEANGRSVVAALQTAAEAGAAVVVATHDDLFRGVGQRHRIADGRIAGVTA